MDINERVENLERLVNYLSEKIDGIRLNLDDDIAEERRRTDQITPYTATKTAYIGDTEVVFENAPEGNGSVFLSPDNKVYFWPERVGNNLCICFESPLEEVTTVSISIQ